MALSWNLRLISESPSGSSEIRPVPVTASCGDAASIWPLRSVPRSARSPVTWPTASPATVKSVIWNLKSFRGTSNVPRPLAESVTVPASAASR
jgi:hypothetical protein